jgi:hypothetical protein
MRRLSWLFVFAFAGACSPIPMPQVLPMPQVPLVQSDAGSQCVRRCQAHYNLCLGDTAEYGAEPYNCGGFSDERRHINACRENLDGCYGACPA